MSADDLFLIGLIALSVLFIAVGAVRSRRNQPSELARVNEDARWRG